MSFFIVSEETKKDRIYSTNPINIKRNGRETLNPFLMGNTLLVKINKEVVKITTLVIIVTISVQSVRSISIAKLATNSTPPIDKLSDFICVTL